MNNIFSLPTKNQRSILEFGKANTSSARCFQPYIPQKRATAACRISGAGMGQPAGVKHRSRHQQPSPASHGATITFFITNQFGRSASEPPPRKTTIQQTGELLADLHGKTEELCHFGILGDGDKTGGQFAPIMFDDGDPMVVKMGKPWFINS